jgi:DNA-binding NarL/FixJ family response regulator
MGGGDVQRGRGGPGTSLLIPSLQAARPSCDALGVGTKRLLAGVQQGRSHPLCLVVFHIRFPPVAGIGTRPGPFPLGIPSFREECSTLKLILLVGKERGRFRVWPDEGGSQMIERVEAETSRLVVTGLQEGACHLLAQWLTEMGRHVVLANTPMEYQRRGPSIWVCLASNREDLQHLPSPPRHALTNERLFPQVAILAKPSWPLLTDVLRRDVDAAVVLPVSSELLLSVLDEVERAAPFSHPLVLLPQRMVLEVPQFYPAELPTPKVRLTRREREILELLDLDFSNEEIARRLFISPHTVKRHLEHLFRKLEAGSRHEATRNAHRWGLLRTRKSDRLWG